MLIRASSDLCIPTQKGQLVTSPGQDEEEWSFQVIFPELYLIPGRGDFKTLVPMVPLVKGDKRFAVWVTSKGVIPFVR